MKNSLWMYLALVVIVFSSVLAVYNIYTGITEIIKGDWIFGSIVIVSQLAIVYIFLFIPIYQAYKRAKKEGK